MEHISNILSFAELLNMEHLCTIHSLVETARKKLRGEDRMLSVQQLFEIREIHKSSAFPIARGGEGLGDASNLPTLPYHSQKSED